LSSDGIDLEPEIKTVFANKDNMWRYSINFIAYGKDVDGDEIKGSCRIYFIKPQEENDSGPFSGK